MPGWKPKAAPVAKDCEPTQPNSELKPITFTERSIPEGSKLAAQALGELLAVERVP